MKRLLHWLFPICAASLALFGTKVDAEPPLLPVATCNEGKCVISQKDYETLRSFHIAVLTNARAIQQENNMLQEAVSELRQQLIRAAFCQGNKS